MNEPRFKPGDLVVNKQKHLILILEVRTYYYECLAFTFWHFGKSFCGKKLGIDQEIIDTEFILIEDFVN